MNEYCCTLVGLPLPGKEEPTTLFHLHMSDTLSEGHSLAEVAANVLVAATTSGVDTSTVIGLQVNAMVPLSPDLAATLVRLALQGEHPGATSTQH